MSTEQEKLEKKMRKKRERIEKKMRKKNIAFKEHRLFTFPPKNTVVIVENKLTKNSKVVAGFKISFPFEQTVAVDTAMKHLDLPASNFDNIEEKSVVIDAAITYRVKGGEKPSLEKVEGTDEEKQVIKSRNREVRRKWQREHGALKTYYSLKNDPFELQLNIQNTVYDAIRSYCSKKTYKELLTADFEQDADFLENINERLDKYGVEIVDFRFKNVDQGSKELSEAKNKREIEEENAKANLERARGEAQAKLETAKGEAQAMDIMAKAEASKVKAVGQAEIEVLESKVGVVGGLNDAAQTTVLGGKNVRNVNFVGLPNLFEGLEGLQRKTSQKNSIETPKPMVETQPVFQVQPENKSNIIPNAEDNKFYMQYPHDNNNALWDGKTHEIKPHCLYNMQSTSYYYMEYKDVSVDTECMTLLQSTEYGFQKVPLTPVSAYGELREFAVNTELKEKPIEYLQKNIYSQSAISMDEFKANYQKEIDALNSISNGEMEEAEEVVVEEEPKVETNNSEIISEFSGVAKIAPGVTREVNDDEIRDLFSRVEKAREIGEQGNTSSISEVLNESEDLFDEPVKEEVVVEPIQEAIVEDKKEEMVQTPVSEEQDLFDEPVVEEVVTGQVVNEVSTPVIESSEEIVETKEYDPNATENFDPSMFKTPNAVSLPEVEAVDLELDNQPKVEDPDFSRMLQMIDLKGNEAKKDKKEKTLDYTFVNMVNDRRR